MFEVIFEVNPKSSQWDAYLGYAKLLKPELKQVKGFIDNVRYKSLTREGWLLSLSSWADEKALVRWRTEARHHEVQEKGRFEVFEDYHLRVGEIVSDTRPPRGQVIDDHRLEETEVGPAKMVLLIESNRSSETAKNTSPTKLAAELGYSDCDGLVAWDIFEAVLTPGDLILLMSFRDEATANGFKAKAKLPPESRIRAVRVVRDYGMRDRREAPQYYQEVN